MTERSANRSYLAQRVDRSSAGALGPAEAPRDCGVGSTLWRRKMEHCERDEEDALQGQGGSRGRLACAVAVLVALMVACGDDDEITSTSTTSSTSSTSTTMSSTSTTALDDGPRLAQSCTHEERDVRIVVSYPENWYVNGEGASPCSAFDPQPVNLRQGTEFPLDLAVVVRLEGASLGGPITSEGQRSVRYVIDAGDQRSIIAITWDVEGNDFEMSKKVLDRMVNAFDIEPRER